MSEDCIFCKIVAGEIPSAKVYEDEDVYAFLDLSQVAKGHTLVIPKKHSRNLYDTSPEVAGKLFEVVPKIAKALKAAYDPLGMNLLNNNEAEANQSVFHLHLHLIPKYELGQGFDVHWETNEDLYSPEDLAEIAEKINQQLK